MFTVKDAVENRGSSPVTLHPYGLVSRHGRPTTLGYYVLHEGLIGVLGDKGLQEYTYDAIDKEGAVPGQNTTRQGVGRRDRRLRRHHRQVLGRGGHPGPGAALPGLVHVAPGRDGRDLPGQHARRRARAAARRARSR